MSDYTPSLDNLSLQYALSKDPGNGRTTEEWWAIRDAAQAEFDRAIAKVRTDAKVEALWEAAADLTEVVDGIQSSGSPNPLTWQTGALAMRDLLKSRADSLEAS